MPSEKESEQPKNLTMKPGRRIRLPSESGGPHMTSSASSSLLNEIEVPKEMVDFLLRNAQANVICEAEKRTRSDVWKYFGRVRLADGHFCKDVVACVGCHMVYLYRSKSQGTSTLRHHKCPYVFKVLGKDMVKPRLVPYNLKQEGDARHGTREMSSESEDRKPVMSSSPSLKERSLNSPPPQQLHAGGLHGGLQSSVGNMSGGRLSAGPNSSGTPPPQGQQQQQQGQVKEQSPPTQLLCVRWGNFDSNIVSMFTKLRAQEHFIDVTLWCDGMTIKCHKMVLSACSTYFEKLLTENPNPHPIIFLKDMQFWEVTALVEFMYRGEVSIHQEKLQSLLRAAESLQIKGLGSPSANDGGAGGIRSGAGSGSLEASSGVDDDLSNGTMDMSTTSLNNNNSLSNNNNSSSHNNQSSNSSNHNNSNSGGNMSHRHNNHIREDRALHGALANSLNQAHLHTSSPGATAAAAALNAHSLLNMHMGMDLSNHGSSGGAPLGLSNIHSNALPLALSLSSALHNNNNNSNINHNQSGPCAKRRKKETPRRIDIPRPNLPVPVFNSTMASEQIEDDVDDNASDDSMAAHERNHVDGFKQEAHPEMTYDDEEEGEGQETYGEHDPGSQMEDDRSDSEQGGELEEDMERGDGSGGLAEETDESGALSLRVTSAAERDRLERERSRKGNPIKKIHIGNNNNNESLIHSASTGGD